MLSFDFINKDVLNWNGKSFLPLGKLFSSLNHEENSELENKLSGKTFEKPSAIWATLGWSDNSPFKPSGALEFSKDCNLDSKGVTLNEVLNIWDFNPMSQKKGFKVQERFINFDKTDFHFEKNEFDFSEIPTLQLTLFLNPDEGAIVYYQHSDKEDYHSNKADVEYILPQRTDSNYSSDRDRLHYVFPIIPPKLTAYNEDTGKLYLKPEEIESSFIIKVLTFKRHNLAADELYKEASSNINLWLDSNLKKVGQHQKKEGLNGKSHRNRNFHFVGNRKYSLLKFDSNHDEFFSIDKNSIDTSKKTLLLLHGTFSSTSASYNQLYGNDNSLLKKFIQHGIFDQIIGFDHPTMIHDAFDNSRVLYSQLDGLVFEKAVDILSYSRGALLAKWLASDPQNNFFETANIITFSGANGIGYFKSNKYVSKGLSIIKKIIPGPTSKLVGALAQFSAEFFLQLPGNQQMTPNNQKLVKILTTRLLSEDTRVQTVASDWDRTLETNSSKRPFTRALDGIIKFILGPKHDWVVGFAEQQISPDPLDHPIAITSMHMKNFDLEYLKSNTHDIIYNYFKLKRQSQKLIPA